MGDKQLRRFFTGPTGEEVACPRMFGEPLRVLVRPLVQEGAFMGFRYQGIGAAPEARAKARCCDRPDLPSGPL